MSRYQRIHAVACAMVRALHHGRWHDARVDREARDNATVRRIAESALDAADETREPGECQQGICKTCGATFDRTIGHECSCEP